jgi:glutaredoxin
MEKHFKGIIIIILFIPLLLRVSVVVSGEVYKWRDKDGNIIFSDTPPPPGVEVEIKEFKEKASDGPKGKENINFPKPKSENFKEKRSHSDVIVIMYMTPWCPYCDKTRTYLRSLDVNLVEYNIEQDKKKREEMLVKSGGSRGVPLIDVEGIIIKGYNPDALKAAIERRRSL